MKVIIWDFDATLGFRRGGWSATLAEVLRDEGIVVQPERIRLVIGKGFPWNFPERIRRPPETPDVWWENLESLFSIAFRETTELVTDRIHELAGRVRNQYLREESWELFPDTMTALASLDERGWHQIILSNHVPELGMIVERLGIDRFFRRIISSALIGIEKPNPAAFHYAVSLFPEAERFLMVGDNPIADILGAQAVGIPAILVRTKSTSSVRRCEDLKELVNILL